MLVYAPFDQCPAEGAALRDEGYLPCGRISRKRSYIKAQVRPYEAKAVGADQSYRIALQDTAKLFLAPLPFFPYLPEAGGDNDCPFDTGLSALLDDGNDRRSRGQDNGQIDLAGAVCDVGVGVDAEKALFPRIDRKDLSPLREEQVLQYTLPREPGTSLAPIRAMLFGSSSFRISPIGHSFPQGAMTL